jgi:hypothetical protein
MRSARRLLERCPVESRQLVLDEVATIAARGALRRGALGLPGKLVQCAVDGSFVTSRKTVLEGSRGPARVGATVAPDRGVPSAPKASSEIAKQALATIRANLTRTRGTWAMGDAVA